MALEARPEVMPRTSAILKRKVLWFLPVRLDGSAGWVVSEIAGGAPDPAAAASGVTMMLKTTRRMDANAPEWLILDRFPASFSLDNYGEGWQLLLVD
jgi:hypothetical protein